MNINEYINTHLNDKIQRRGNAPLVPIAIALVGIAANVLALTANVSDIIQTTLLTVGFILAATGLIWTVLCFSKVLWHYEYLPTSSTMHDKNIYLSPDDYHLCTDMLENGYTDLLNTLIPVISSNTVLHIVYSSDRSIALLQTGRLETSRIETSSPVVVLTGDSAKKINTLLH